MHTCDAHLQTLSLDQTASFDQIREAYQDLVMVWHPDRFLHNPRLYKKAEEKLKQVNQAYAYFKSQKPRVPKQTPVDTKSSVSSSSPPPAASSKPKTAYRRRGGSCPWLSFADAEYILSHYCFHAVTTREVGHQTYHSGPFVLDACQQPAAVTLSVPCDSAHAFDRILFSIPCKSRGHFCQEEAEQLLQLLHESV